MSEEDVALLDARGVGGGHVEEDVGVILHLAAALARHGDNMQSHLLGSLEGLEDVLGVAGGGDADDDIALFGGAAQQAREHQIIAVVVAHGGEVGGVAVQGLGIERGTVVVEAAGELRRQVLGVRRAAAVAAEMDLAAGPQRLCHHIRRRLHPRHQRFVRQNMLFYFDTLQYGFANSCIHIQFFSRAKIQ